MFTFLKKSNEPVAWIITFLGNPGLRYENTRHNAGFMTADIIADEMGIKINRAKFSSLTAVTQFGGERVLLLKPQTYMNLSGDAVRQAIRFYKLPQRSIIVVSDDVALPAGKLRIRRNGSAGGHNGLKDIISKCGGEDFIRVRIGVGSPPNENYEMIDWVLSKLSDSDAVPIRIGAQKAASAVEMIVTSGVEKAMAEFN